METKSGTLPKHPRFMITGGPNADEVMRRFVRQRGKNTHTFTLEIIETGGSRPRKIQPPDEWRRMGEINVDITAVSLWLDELSFGGKIISCQPQLAEVLGFSPKHFIFYAYDRPERHGKIRLTEGRPVIYF